MFNSKEVDGYVVRFYLLRILKGEVKEVSA
jgi:hypothetical protein